MSDLFYKLGICHSFRIRQCEAIDQLPGSFVERRVVNLLFPSLFNVLAILLGGLGLLYYIHYISIVTCGLITIFVRLDH